jgi:tyrosinase
MPLVRRDVLKLPKTDKTLEWYSKAVDVLKAEPITDVTSWWSLGAMHGIDVDVWKGFHFIKSTPTPPSGSLWKQCQHQTWYFLPWHRGYLVAFERILRDVIANKLKGPKDWTLPYWDYSDGGAAARQLPAAFAKATGTTKGLFVPQRYGTGTKGHPQSPIKMDSRVVAVDRTMTQRFFEGSNTGSPGFGGLKTPCSHGDDHSPFGVLEGQPHGPVHVALGGGDTNSSNPTDWGLMTNPDTAALDPIFWLHHANIDRLWGKWLRQKRKPTDPSDVFANPTDTDWLDGPQDRQFVMPRPDGTTYHFTARDVLDTKAPALDYIYDDESAPPPSADHLEARLESLGVPKRTATTIAGAPMAPPKPAELIGGSAGPVVLNKDVVETRVRLDSGQSRQLSAARSVQAMTESVAPKVPDRVYLNLENVRSKSDAGLFYVYVNLPANADPEKHPECFAGTLSMFGVSKATAQSGSGNGLNASFDITPIVDKLSTQNALSDDLSVKLVAAKPGGTSPDISIGHVRIYRQDQ